MAISFSSNEATVIGRDIQFDSNCSHTSPTPKHKLEEVYELARCVQWIKGNRYKKVGLQFPDSMLVDSVEITLILEEATKVELFIFGDTTYGSCCVDEIAAEHVGCDAILHFGRSCLTPTAKLPVLYIFGQLPINVSHTVEEFKNLFPDSSGSIILMYDVKYLYAADLIADQLKETYKNVIITKLLIPSNLQSIRIKHPGDVVVKCGRIMEVPKDVFLPDCCIFYIGPESLTQANIILSFNICKFCSYDPIRRQCRWETIDVNRTLRKRYYMIERAKDANIIGILVGTLGIINYLDIIERLKILIREAGKKSYTIVVGKPNIPKLANFPEINVFVLVACPENTVLDSKEFFQPIVTPFELEVALNSARKWTGEYITDFRDLLPGSPAYLPIGCPGELTQDVSLITGKLRTFGHRNEEQNNSDRLIQIRNTSLAVSPLHQNAAGEQLSYRSWRGLEQKLGQTSVTKAVEGLEGIASEYLGEGMK